MKDLHLFIIGYRCGRCGYTLYPVDVFCQDKTEYTARWENGEPPFDYAKAAQEEWSDMMQRMEAFTKAGGKIVLAHLPPWELEKLR